jgi:hypothetical protein
MFERKRSKRVEMVKGKVSGKVHCVVKNQQGNDIFSKQKSRFGRHYAYSINGFLQRKFFRIQWFALVNLKTADGLYCCHHVDKLIGATHCYATHIQLLYTTMNGAASDLHRSLPAFFTPAF